MLVQLKTLGCRLNEAELENWAHQFQQQGCDIAADGDAADLVVVNTCAVTQEAVRKSRKLLRRSQRQNPCAKLVVSGCFASLDAESVIREQGVDLVVSNQDKDRLVDIALNELVLESMPKTAMDVDEPNPLFARGRQRAFIKVQDGCRYRCTFCIVTHARGEERSRPIGEIVDQVNRLQTSGIKEVVLAGVHLGGYGSDRETNLLELCSALLADTDIERIRLGSLEPWDLPDGLWRLFDNPRLMPHLHLPLQAGTDSVLRRMARRCKTDEFARLVTAARDQVPDINLTTDIIVGFPGETDSEWRQTLEFVQGIGFGHIHLFAYSPRSGTKAASLPGQIPAEIKRARSAELQSLAATMKRETLKRGVGRRYPVLVETLLDDSDNWTWTGYTPSYMPIRIYGNSSGDLINQIVDVEATGTGQDGEFLIGRISRSAMPGQD